MFLPPPQIKNFH